jgi:hypothetical protein
LLVRQRVLLPCLKINGEQIQSSHVMPNTVPRYREARRNTTLMGIRTPGTVRAFERVSCRSDPVDMSIVELAPPLAFRG